MSSCAFLPGSDITYAIPVVAVDDTSKCQCKSSTCKNDYREELLWWGHKNVFVTEVEKSNSSNTCLFSWKLQGRSSML